MKNTLLSPISGTIEADQQHFPMEACPQRWRRHHLNRSIHIEIVMASLQMQAIAFSAFEHDNNQ